MPQSADQDRASLLEGSIELLGEIRAAWIEIEHGRDRRSTAVAALCQMSLDHAMAVQSLMATLPQSAISLVRPQHKTLIRATATFLAPEWSSFARVKALRPAL